MRVRFLYVIVEMAVVFVVTQVSELLASAITDTTNLVVVSTFSLVGYSTEGADVTLYINAKTKDSVVTTIYFGETRRTEYRLVFNKKPIYAERTIYDYDMQKKYESGIWEIASVKKATLKTSSEDEKELMEEFSEIRKELAKRAPIRQGFEYLDKGDKERNPSYYDLAIEKFSQAIEVNKLNDDEAYFGRGRAHLRKGDNNQAIVDFTMAIQFSPYNAIYKSNRGRAYARVGDYDRAIVDFEAAAKIEPENKLIKQNLERAKRREKGF